MTSKEIRQKFLDFFQTKKHLRYNAAPLVSMEDKSVLFTTAGMQQFKKYYIEPSAAPAKRIVTIQSCVRTSDIEEVGDKTHLTYFEMLGNFSFGNFSKKEAIEWAWEFLTKELSINPTRISATYFDNKKALGKIIFEEPDNESKAALESIDGLIKIENQGDDNFWTLGTEGSPGGPTVEFYVDNIEIWNLVFNEAIWTENHWHWPRKGELLGLDTGMGLERLSAVINNYDSVYDIDIYEKAKSKKQKAKIDDEKDQRILLDHLRASEALTAENLLPSNKEQGYVLRRLIRRVALICKRNNIDFNEITKSQILLNEFVKFNQTIKKGQKQIEKLKEIDGQKLFDLYQSFGFPAELTIEEAVLKNIPVDKNAQKEFEKLIAKHQELSRTASAGMFKGGLESQDENSTKYHTATHLLLAALRKVINDNICQRGSNITNERLRFDFNFDRKLEDIEIKKIEDLVNNWIEQKLPVEKIETTLAEAKKSGATGIFDNKYGENVTVYRIGRDPSTHTVRSGSNETIVSFELCGGPHVKNTGDLGHFKIQKEESSSAGIRRIKAVLE